MEMEREKLEEQAHAHEAGVAENHVNTLHSEADLSDQDEASEEHHDTKMSMWTTAVIPNSNSLS